MVQTHSRIAPTPSGYLHVGNALNFIITWLWVRKEGGSLRLRIDDLDAPRAKFEYLEDIFRSLEWLGMDWDDGPQTPDEHMLRYSQQLRAVRYEALIEQLIESGNVFACDCSRKDIQSENPGGQYPGTCRNKGLPLDLPDTSLRILTPEYNMTPVPDMQKGLIPITLYQEMRDFIIRRRDKIAAYQIVSLADDIDFNINLIIRGEDLLPSTAAQLFLAEIVGATTFAQTTFYHHPLLKDEHGHKLSKSTGSMSLKTWREQDKQPAEFYRFVSKQLGWGKEAGSLTEMLQGVKEALPIVMKPG